uniref:Uncharacterized protein n=1 Tax=Arundo donax TaxID=35708 RepID=A0A0A9BXH9_ARUDO
MLVSRTYKWSDTCANTVLTHKEPSVLVNQTGTKLFPVKPIESIRYIISTCQV